MIYLIVALLGVIFLALVAIITHFDLFGDDE